ncbi:MAG: hypothetical protein H0W12_07170 [Chitinophagaceae bacterium]|nr:hypothetical protein [Chitinophagaceae bacterium]
MKRLILFFLTGIAFSCNDQGSASKDAKKDSTSTTTTAATMNYPYKIDHPDNWDIGSTANSMIALNAVKAFQDGNVEGSMKYFGDSVHMQFDGLDKKMSNDSLKAMFTTLRKDYKNLDIKMYDWESVISKDKKDEWVTIWYKEKWEDMKGIKDSSEYINDFQLKDGKIVSLDEYTRKLH